MEVRNRIIDAAARVFQEHGSRGATTRLIAQEAGVNEVTLFRHFGTKERLLQEALAAASERREGEAPLPAEPADPLAELEAWCRAGMRHLNAVRSLIRTSMGEFEEHPQVSSCVATIPLRVAEELRSYLLRLRERGWIERDADSDAAASMLMGAMFSDATSRDVMPDRWGYPLEEAPARYVALLARAIGLRRGGRGVEREQ